MREKWAGANLNRGYGHPKAEGYQATPPARTRNDGLVAFNASERVAVAGGWYARAVCSPLVPVLEVGDSGSRGVAEDDADGMPAVLADTATGGFHGAAEADAQ